MPKKAQWRQGLRKTKLVLLAPYIAQLACPFQKGRRVYDQCKKNNNE
jgi:hypothetical protein